MQDGYEYLEPIDGKTYVCGYADDPTEYTGLVSAGATDGPALGSLASLGWFTGSDGSSGAVAGDPDVAEHSDGTMAAVVPGAARFWSYSPSRAPYSSSNGTTNLTGVAAGDADLFILEDYREFRARWTDQGVPLFLRPWWEFNGKWSSGSDVYSTFQLYKSDGSKWTLNTNAAYVAGWKRLVILAGRGQGARTIAQVNAHLSAAGLDPLLSAAEDYITNTLGGTLPETPMAFVWCPNREPSPDNADNQPELRYPSGTTPWGADYVDWVAMDMYPRQDLGPSGQNNLDGNGDGAAHFENVIWSSWTGRGPEWLYATYCAPGTAEKPMAVPEISVTSPWDYTNGDAFCAAWFGAFFAKLRAHPKLKLFNLYNNASGGAGDHRVDLHNGRSAPLTTAVWSAEILSDHPDRYILDGSEVATASATGGGSEGTGAGTVPAFVDTASATPVGGSGSSGAMPTHTLTVPLPASASAGDSVELGAVVSCFGTNSLPPTFAALAGWDQVGGGYVQGPSATTTRKIRYQVWRRRLDGTEGASVEVTWNADEEFIDQYVLAGASGAYSGTHPTSPQDGDASAGSVDGTEGATIAAPAITTAAAGRRLVAWAFGSNDSQSVNAAGWTDPASLTARVALTTATGADCALHLLDGAQAAEGDTGAFALTLNDSDPAAALTYALAPEVAGRAHRRTLASARRGAPGR